jgi:hypothetical protein
MVIPAMCAAILIAASFGYLWNAVPRYTVSAVVSDVSDDVFNRGDMGGGLLSLGQFMGLGGPPDRAFESVLTVIGSHNLADILERKYGFAERLLTRAELRNQKPLSAYVFPKVPISNRTPADALAQFIQDNVVVSRNQGPQGQNARFWEISVSHRDPAAAKLFISALVREADEVVRAEMLHEEHDRVAALTSQLKDISQADIRTGLAKVIIEEEEKQALLLGSAPFAAMILDGPAASSRPTSPKYAVTLLVAGLAGLGVGWAAQATLFRPRNSV